jgi:hypothetical protein
MRRGSAALKGVSMPVYLSRQVGIKKYIEWLSNVENTMEIIISEIYQIVLP